MGRVTDFTRNEAAQRAFCRWRTKIARVVAPFLFAVYVSVGRHPVILLPLRANPKSVAALLLLPAGVFMRCWARGYFHPGRVFTNGPYAMVRHPLYIGSFMIGAGMLLVLDYWLFWAAFLPCFVVFSAAAIIYEENSLQRKFGGEWDAYAATTPAVIPSLKKIAARAQNSGAAAKGWSLGDFLRTGELFTTFFVLAALVLIEIIEAL